MKKLNILFLFTILSCQDNYENCLDLEYGTEYIKITGVSKFESNYFKYFCKTTEVFGIKIYATEGVKNEKLLHAASIMAEYLDNDEDGLVDNQKVLDKLIDKKVWLLVIEEGLDFDDAARNPPANYHHFQDLYNEEIALINGSPRFDATLEEILHIITQHGYAEAYPDKFSERKDSKIANAMDIARGGYFKNVPDEYPSSAWYFYYDSTCDYACQITEYMYWTITSILGAQEYPGRLDEIKNEWRLNTKDKVENTDIATYELLTNPEYKFPTNLPNGKYRIP
ncbi:MAG TPA: hypothetical protein EYQ68_03005 [Cytophagales bacterium]|nr:hypothetical protein [Cytophagales bacterium]